MSDRVGRMRPRAAPPRPARRKAGADGGSGPGGPASRLFLPVLLVTFVLFGLSTAWRWWGPGRPDEEPRRTTPRAAAFRGAPVRVEVVNGSGEPGAAAKLASYLRDGGFNVVLVGSGDRYDYVRTLVVDRSGNDKAAAAVASYLGDVQRVRQRARSEADVTVVVGRDRGRVPWGEGPPKKGRG
jgi:hypothetical protein